MKAEKEEPLVLCSRIPDEEDDLEANHHQIQKEEEEEEGEDDYVEQFRKNISVPCDDDYVMHQNHQMREEETAFIAKGEKRKRGHDCHLCENIFPKPSELTLSLIHI